MLEQSFCSNYKIISDDITNVTDATTFSLESLDDQHTYQMQQLYQLVFKLCMLNYSTCSYLSQSSNSNMANDCTKQVHNFTNAFAGGLEPCVLMYARMLSRKARDICRFVNLDCDVSIQEAQITEKASQQSDIFSKDFSAPTSMI